MNFLMKRIWVVLAGALFLFSSSAIAMPIFVGSFNVFDGPSAATAPEPLSAREAAALLFGGLFSDYAISVSSSLDPNSITHTAWLDGVIDTQYLETPASEDFVVAAASGFYDDYPSYSAFVCDHADCVADGFPVSAGWLDYNYTNYVWRLEAVVGPTLLAEPNPFLLILTAFLVWLTGRWFYGKAHDKCAWF